MIKLLSNKLRLSWYSRRNRITRSALLGKNIILNRSIIGEFSLVGDGAALNHTVLGDYSTIGRASKVVHTELGKYCAVSWDVTLNATSHPHNHLSNSAFPYSQKLGGFVDYTEILKEKCSHFHFRF